MNKRLKILNYVTIERYGKIKLLAHRRRLSLLITFTGKTTKVNFRKRKIIPEGRGKMQKAIESKEIGKLAGKSK